MKWTNVLKDTTYQSSLKKKNNLIISISIKEMQNLVKIIPIKLQKTGEFY